MTSATEKDNFHYMFRLYTIADSKYIIHSDDSVEKSLQDFWKTPNETYYSKTKISSKISRFHDSLFTVPLRAKTIINKYRFKVAGW